LLDISLLATGKGDLCRDIMGELPGWFDQPEANADCANIVEQLPLLACHVDGVVVGFAALQPHPPSAMEIFVMAVRRQFHRQGIGHRLIAASEELARDAACRLLTVKTLAPRDREEPQYAATCAFTREAASSAPRSFQNSGTKTFRACSWSSRSTGDCHEQARAFRFRRRGR
jgi:N-acetylglutamate synthase-like GNAT family acetyltransferase